MAKKINNFNLISKIENNDEFSLKNKLMLLTLLRNAARKESLKMDYKTLCPILNEIEYIDNIKKN